MGSPNELSFLPDDYLERKARRRANAVCGGLAVVVLGAVCSTFMYTERAMREVEQRQAQVDAVYTDAARRIEQANEMRAQQGQVVRRAELAATLLEKVPRSNLLAEFTNSLPAGVSLLDLSLDSRKRAAPVIDAKTAFEQKKAALEGRVLQVAAEPARFDVTIKLTGVAGTDVQVAQLITKLNSSSLVRDVNLLISDSFESQGVTLRKFQIEMMLDPAAEVSLPAAETKTAAVELNEPAAAAK
jgi:Tfp pilus assembly protein PilN